MPKIYESPDGGKTIREREFGDYDNSITYTLSPDSITELENYQDIVWVEAQEETYVRAQLIKKYPELAEAWAKFKELEKHYKAWDLLQTDPIP